MVNVDELMEEEINALKQEEYVELGEEVNLEELLLLGDDKKIPIIISFPLDDGSTVKAKALVKQLTMKEINNLKLDKKKSPLEISLLILENSLFKQDNTLFKEEELLSLPIGVVNAIGNKILELSGVELTDVKLNDF